MILDKPSLRRVMKDRLAKIDDISVRSLKLLRTFQESAYLATLSRVSIFISLADEIETRPIIDHCWRWGIEVAIPEHRIQSDSDSIVCRLWEKDVDLIQNNLGIAHPSSGDSICVDTVDLVFLPGLAFTLDGKRLGRGGGFYDRMLESFSGRTIGLCFEEQILDTLPVEDHDFIIDEVWTC